MHWYVFHVSHWVHAHLSISLSCPKNTVDVVEFAVKKKLRSRVKRRRPEAEIGNFKWKKKGQ